jgi:hypothetical protein
VNSSTLSRIRTFREQVLLPALADIEQLLEGTQKHIEIASNAETEHTAVNAMLQQMHFGKPYLNSTSSKPLDPQASSTIPQTWIGDSVYIEILQNAEADLIRIGQYCWSIEFRILSVDHIQILSIIGHSKAADKALQIRQHPFADDTLTPLSLEEIDGADIILSFTESYDAFEAQLPEVVLEENSEPEAVKLNPTSEPIESERTAFPLILEAPPTPRAIAPEPTQDPEPSAPVVSLTPQQQLYALKQKAIDLSQKLAPSPHNALSCKLNPELSTTARIVALRDQYHRVVNLCLEYSPTITEGELTEQLQRLGHYQHLDHLANQRRFIEDQMQAWLNLYGQPSEGTIAHQLKDRIAQQSKTLYHHLYNLAESCLNTLTAHALQTDLEQATEEQHQEKDYLDALEQNPILGYLDARLLERDIPLESINPFTNSQPITLHAQFIRRKGKEPHNTVMLTHIASCQSESYQAYRQRFPDLPAIHLAIRYTLSQKLYPNRSLSIGPAPKPVTPRLELRWDGTAETTPENPFLQIWQLFPALPTQPTQWLLVTVTSETQKLKTVVLEDGQIAQEGTKEYLMRSLQLMMADSDESTRELGTAVSEAVEQSRMRWVYLHQTQDLETGELRDIVQLQFQLSEPR